MHNLNTEYGSIMQHLRLLYLKSNKNGEVFTLPEYVGESASGGSGTFDGEDRDALFDDAARMLVQHQQGSASLLQRKMKIGYNRAGRLIDQMEEAGIIGPFEGSKARQVLISDLDTLEQFLKEL